MGSTVLAWLRGTAFQWFSVPPVTLLPSTMGYGSLFKTDSGLQPSSVGAPAMYHESLGKTQAPHSNMPLPCKLTACHFFHLANAFGSGPAIFWDILPPHIYMATHKLWLPWDLSPLLTGSRWAVDQEVANHSAFPGSHLLYCRTRSEHLGKMNKLPFFSRTFAFMHWER